MKTPLALPVLLLAACHSHMPWESGVRSLPAAQENAGVRTLNRYDRNHSHVLVREIARPTRATLDYAAYHANFMIADEAPEAPSTASAQPKLEHLFGDFIDRDTLTADITTTPLDADERRQPLAFAPLSEYLLARKVEGADRLEELGSAVRSESWGQPATPGVATQSVTEVYLRAQPPELWVKIEFAPWFRGLGELPDQDHDGYPELYGRARADRLTPAARSRIDSDYAGQQLTGAEVKAWANQLSSYWYPSFNTDLVPAGSRWPDEQTEAPIRQELAGLSVAPAFVLRGKPQGQSTYLVFVIDGLKSGLKTEVAVASRDATRLATSRPTPAPEATAARIAEELQMFGAGAWDGWIAKLAPFRNAVQKKLAASPARIKAFAGSDGFLFYRNSMDFVAGGDLEQQPAGKNPLPIIVAWKQQLEKLGVDFLFVPVPAKLEIFPDGFDPPFRDLRGAIVAPQVRRFAASLAAQGVEVVDLHTPFLAARTADDGGSGEPLYQRQDTHWSARGLELAAHLLAARIKRYPWYAELARKAQTFTTQDTTFTRFGDLHSRLPEPQKKRYQPETLAAHRVMRADGAAYDDDPDSPIVVLGDSFTGVYELTDAEHAGLSAHIARDISYPIDLVMSYGGGPNVRTKLLRRGEAELAKKKLVIWVMADRDLYQYWEDWQPVAAP
jgi:alginate O-acetyltransferase complex protein AlgJ